MAWATAAATLATYAATVVVMVSVGSRQTTSEWGTGRAEFVWLLAFVAFPVVGLLVATRKPSNAIGWICLLIGLSIGVNLAATAWAVYGFDVKRGALPGAVTAAWLSNWLWALWTGLIGSYLVLLFPDGRLPSHRWRWFGWVPAFSILTMSLTEALTPGTLADVAIENPYAIDAIRPLMPVLGVLALLMPVTFIASMASLVVRYRRAPSEQRQQLKWVATAAVFVAVLFGFAGTGAMLMGEGPTPVFMQVAQDLVTISFAGIPVAVGFAILRYRLYDIDRVINRAVVYTILTLSMAGFYAGAVILLQRLTAPFTGRSDLAVAGSTLAVAAMFRPALSRIRAFVNRRFYRRTYDATRTIEAFGSRLRDQIDLDTLTRELVRATSETVQPAHVSLWLKQAPPAAID
ncbi:MAG TPA: hypothetical protein VNE62_00380 [Actinomycetota bacterium]|nr:hypothetical protein [Actinomycetota bacterium]